MDSANFSGLGLQFADFAYSLWNPLTICGFRLHLRNPEQLPMFVSCGIRNKINVPTKFTLEEFVRGIHGSFVSGSSEFQLQLRIWRQLKFTKHIYYYLHTDSTNWFRIPHILLRIPQSCLFLERFWAIQSFSYLSVESKTAKKIKEK